VNYHLSDTQVRYVAKLAVLYDKSGSERERLFRELDDLWKQMSRYDQETIERYLAQNDPPPHRRGVL
jgi:uncharacterized coiled-coil protein SlyX